VIVVPTPDHPYYLWQSLVQAQWLRERGWPVTFLVYCQGDRPSARLRRLMAGGVADWRVWPEWRTQDERGYDACMKPWLVGKYLSAHPELVDEQLLIVDPDALPLRPWPVTPPWVLLGTDTDGYTGPAWLDSKGALEPLCELLYVDPDAVRGTRGIGAQYVTRGIPGWWWEQVARDSIRAFRLLKAHPVDAQPWCAEMYVTHLAAVRAGYQPTASEAMSMVWANGPVSEWQSEGFFHDAGQQQDDGRHFCKLVHQSSPWHADLQVDPGSSSAPYVDLIRRTAAEHPGLVW